MIEVRIGFDVSKFSLTKSRVDANIGSACGLEVVNFLECFSTHVRIISNHDFGENWVSSTQGRRAEYANFISNSQQNVILMSLINRPTHFYWLKIEASTPSKSTKTLFMTSQIIRVVNVPHEVPFFWISAPRQKKFFAVLGSTQH